METSMRKRIIFLLLLLSAVAQLYAAKTAYAIWCSGNKTLYFTYSNASLAKGGTYEGQTITGLWSGDKVLRSGTSAPGWNMTVRETMERVVFAADFAEAKPASLRSWFYFCTRLTRIEGLDHLNTASVTNMQSTFDSCSALTQLDLSTFSTSNVTTMNSMFADCTQLASVRLDGFTTPKLESTFKMFANCVSLVSVDLSSFATSSVSSMGYMFSGCSALRTIGVSSKWRTDRAVGQEMFEGCFSLVGGAGTQFNASHVDIAYAHIDGGEANPGYLTGIEPSGIGETTERTGSRSGIAYDLRGMRVANPLHKLCIINGKKVAAGRNKK